MPQDEEIIQRLDTIIKLLSAQTLKDEQNQKDKVIKLYSFGLSPKNIAIILNTTSNYVNKTVSEARKEGLL